MTKPIGIYIDGNVNEKSVNLMSATILAILNTRADQETIQLALQTLSKSLGGVNNLSISGVNITMPPIAPECDEEEGRVILQGDDTEEAQGDE